MASGWGDKVEAITVKSSFENFKIRITNAYGPKEKYAEAKRDNFWRNFDDEMMANWGVILHDSHGCENMTWRKVISKVLKDEIKNDLLFEMFIKFTLKAWFYAMDWSDH